MSTTEPYGIIRHGMRHGSVEPRTARRTVTVLITGYYRSTARWTRPDRTAARRPGPAGPVSGARLQGPVATPTASTPATRAFNAFVGWRSPQVIPDDLVLAYIRTARHRL